MPGGGDFSTSVTRASIAAINAVSSSSIAATKSATGTVVRRARGSAKLAGALQSTVIWSPIRQQREIRRLPEIPEVDAPRRPPVHRRIASFGLNLVPATIIGLDEHPPDRPEPLRRRRQQLEQVSHSRTTIVVDVRNLIVSSKLQQTNAADLHPIPALSQPKPVQLRALPTPRRNLRHRTKLELEPINKPSDAEAELEPVTSPSNLSWRLSRRGGARRVGTRRGRRSCLHQRTGS